MRKQESSTGASSPRAPASMPGAGPHELPQRLPAQLVQDLHAAFGEHHARAVHTKGVILQGTFTPTAEARALCVASLFARPVPIIARFSDFTGIPNIPDNSFEANPRGLALKFLMPDGSNLDIVGHSFNGFPTATAREFGELLRAIGASGPGAAKPTALDTFLAGHPAAKTFLTTQKPPPESYATAAYFGVNAFRFTDADGLSRPVRYRFVPEAGERYLDDAALKQRSANYLMEEILARVAAAPVRFTWFAQLAEPGDPLEDPSRAWPETRQLVRLGVLSLDEGGPNTQASDRELLFLPGTLLAGIEVADPMLTIRNATYPLSFHERQ
ncbi:catalase family peroxidase [Aggregicoccus sp. 17bor-14]|uniref:catalase family peroxidase n=1 Tax=Myxococcaceae TaxID=31 RepID=UPI00129C7220|nr:MULTISPECIES: catalase family peroxidase [Myxococcaceae]MBF5042020.1 catalase family peroxidase [Simulacricoccus sp. 17bor-14]MRI87800.1 catalase family peroxidase [Aggregicoccus sp. 17bor-14]